jgi:signal transduction histidine kinase
MVDGLSVARTTVILGGAGAAALLGVVDAVPTVVGIAGVGALVAVALASGRVDGGLSAPRIDQQSVPVDSVADTGASLLEAALDALPIGIVVYRGGRAEYANEAATEVLGARLERIDSLLPTALRDAVRLASRMMVDRPGPEGDGESVRFVVDYPTRTIDATATPLDSEQPDGGSVVLLRLVDVSERLRLDAIRRDFVAAASHELKTPVTAIHAASETVLAAMDDDLAAARRFAERIHTNAERLTSIVSDLLDLSRLENDTPVTEPVDVTEVIVEQVEAVGDRALNIRMELGPASVAGNRSDLGLAVRNLIENAIRYTDAGDPIVVSCRTDAGQVLISIEDGGIGIPAEDLPRVFERFYRVDAARSRATGGTGLGLAIVRHVAERHGGTVEASSELGSGSQFRIRLPVG